MNADFQSTMASIKAMPPLLEATPIIPWLVFNARADERTNS